MTVSTTDPTNPAEKKGFTLIEVMLFLGITGLLLVGLLSGTSSAIARQRYNDTVRNFAEYLRRIYSEVISPESLGEGNADTAVLGKVIVFAPDEGFTKTARSATLIGDAKIPEHVSGGFITELQSVNASLYCGNKGYDSDDQRYASTASYYDLLWQSWLTKVEGSDQSDDDAFEGTIIIARAPTSGTIHTIYAKDLTYDLKEGCTPENNAASDKFNEELKQEGNLGVNNYKYEDIGFCVNSEDSLISREVRIAKDGRNTSAVDIRNTDDEGSRCH